MNPLRSGRLHLIKQIMQWDERARCRGENSAWFFPDQIGHFDAKEAKALCAVCPVRRECLNYAIEADERFGVWGGLTETERRRYVKAKARGGRVEIRVCRMCETVYLVTSGKASCKCKVQNG